MTKLVLRMRRRTPPQKRISESVKRFNIACWGRQSGKTTFGLDKMFLRPIHGRSGGVYWYILQTHDAAEIAFNRYWDMLRKAPWLLRQKPNESEKSVLLRNSAKVFFKSGQNYQDLRSETLDGAIIDEYRQQHPSLWPMIIRPMLSRRRGWADIFSTPNGFDHFYDLFESAKKDNDWGWFHAPSSEAWWWTKQELESSKAVMTDDEYAQEIDADFREIGRGKAYLSHGVHNHKLENPFAPDCRPWSPYLPIIIGLDFNVGVMPWLLGQHRSGQWYWGEEVCLTNTNTQMQAPLLVERVKDHPAGVIIVGDASGKSQKSSASGQTDYSIIIAELTKAGVKYQNLTPEANPPVKDRINCVNARLKAADGSVNMWYNPIKCPRLKRDLERVSWKEGAKGAMLDKSNPDLTHASDAMGYPVTHFADEWRPRPGVGRIIVRTI